MNDSFTKFFIESFAGIIIHLVNGIIDYIINPAIAAVSELVQFAVEALPTGRLEAPGSEHWVPYLEYINWLIPLDAILGGLTLYFSAVISFLTIGPILRWVKLIQYGGGYDTTVGWDAWIWKIGCRR